MRLRGMTAACAGVCAAATGHALDASGRLPFVHEAVQVRAAMTWPQVLAWLSAAAMLSAVAACTRPVVVGAPVALLVSGAPELIGRGDPGAVVEPGAVLGAVVQLLLVVAVVAMASVLERRIAVLAVAEQDAPGALPPPPFRLPSVFAAVDGSAAPRGPPVEVAT